MTLISHLITIGTTVGVTTLFTHHSDHTVTTAGIMEVMVYTVILTMDTIRTVDTTGTTITDTTEDLATIIAEVVILVRHNVTMEAVIEDQLQEIRPTEAMVDTLHLVQPLQQETLTTNVVQVRQPKDQIQVLILRDSRTEAVRHNVPIATLLHKEKIVAQTHHRVNHNKDHKHNHSENLEHLLVHLNEATRALLQSVVTPERLAGLKTDKSVKFSHKDNVAIRTQEHTLLQAEAIQVQVVVAEVLVHQDHIQDRVNNEENIS